MRAADIFVEGFAHLQTGERPIEMLQTGPVRFVRWGSDGRRGRGPGRRILRSRVHRPPVFPEQLADPTVTVLHISVDGEPARTGKLVMIDGHAYLSDIATLPVYGRHGLARSLMSGIHAAARDAGAETTDLTSLDMGRGLYFGLGYAVVREIVIWEPAPPPATPTSPSSVFPSAGRGAWAASTR